MLNDKPIVGNHRTSSVQRAVFRMTAFMGLLGSMYVAWNLYRSYFDNLARYIKEKSQGSQNASSKSQIEAAASSVEAKSKKSSKSVAENVIPAEAEEFLNVANNNPTPIVSEPPKVILYACPRGFSTPSITPNTLKLETFLRVANIPYTVEFSNCGSNNFSPQLSIGDEEVHESTECLKKLSDAFNINLDNQALNARKVACRLVEVMLDNHLYWGIALWRWVLDEGRSIPKIQPVTEIALKSLPKISSTVSKAAGYHGLGRLQPEQVSEILLRDLSDVSSALGNRPYFLGDTPGAVDCNAFALLSQIVWNMPGSPYEEAIKLHPNLVNFVVRMRDNYWPDWNSHLSSRDTPAPHDLFLIPGTEFLQHQVHSDSSQWDSKTTSTATITKPTISPSIPMSNVSTVDGRDANLNSYSTNLTDCYTGANSYPLLEDLHKAGSGNVNANSCYATPERRDVNEVLYSHHNSMLSGPKDNPYASSRFPEHPAANFAQNQSSNIAPPPHYAKNSTIVHNPDNSPHVCRLERSYVGSELNQSLYRYN